MAGVNKIVHKRKEILFIDYKGCESDEDMINLILEAQRIIIEDNKEYLQLSDYSGAYATPKFMKAIRDMAKKTPKLAKKRAIIGINNPAKMMLLQTYNLLLGTNDLRPFGTKEEALDWLVE